MEYSNELVKAAMKLSELMHYPWEFMADGGRDEMCRITQGVIDEYYRQVLDSVEDELK